MIPQPILVSSRLFLEARSMIVIRIEVQMGSRDEREGRKAGGAGEGVPAFSPGTGFLADSGQVEFLSVWPLLSSGGLPVLSSLRRNEANGVIIGSSLDGDGVIVVIGILEDEMVEGSIVDLQFSQVELLKTSHQAADHLVHMCLLISQVSDFHRFPFDGRRISLGSVSFIRVEMVDADGEGPYDQEEEQGKTEFSVHLNVQAIRQLQWVYSRLRIQGEY